MIPLLPAPAIDQITWTGPGDASTASMTAHWAEIIPDAVRVVVRPRRWQAFSRGLWSRPPSAKRLANAGVAVAGAARRHA